jgi:hypothetical protein
LENEGKENCGCNADAEVRSHVNLGSLLSSSRNKFEFGRKTAGLDPCHPEKLKLEMFGCAIFLTQVML